MPCCGARNFLLAFCSRNFDRGHSLSSLHLPLAAIASLPRWRLVYIFAVGKNYSVVPVQPGTNDMSPAYRIHFSSLRSSLSIKKKPRRDERGFSLLVTRWRLELQTHCLKGKALILRARGIQKTCCYSSTFQSSMFCIYVTRPTAYPVIHYNRKTCIRQTFLSTIDRTIIEIDYSITIFKKEIKMFCKTTLLETNIFFTTVENQPQGCFLPATILIIYEAFSPRFSFTFTEYQSSEYDRPTKKYYIIKAQRERNTTPLKSTK